MVPIVLERRSLVNQSTSLYMEERIFLKGGMSLRNGMWHGLRNDIIMRNLIHGQWCKEINLTGKHACVIASPFLAPI